MCVSIQAYEAFIRFTKEPCLPMVCSWWKTSNFLPWYSHLQKNYHSFSGISSLNVRRKVVSGMHWVTWLPFKPNFHRTPTLKIFPSKYTMYHHTYVLSPFSELIFLFNLTKPDSPMRSQSTIHSLRRVVFAFSNSSYQ